MQIIPAKGLLGDEGFASGRGDKCPATTESIVWLTVLGGVEIELPVFTPSDFSLSESEDMSLFYPQTSLGCFKIKKVSKVSARKLSGDRILNVDDYRLLESLLLIGFAMMNNLPQLALPSLSIQVCRVR